MKCSLSKQRCEINNLFQWNKRESGHSIVKNTRGLARRAVGRKRILLFGRFIICINTHLYYMQNLKIIFQGEVCKTDNPPSFSIKTLKNMVTGKDGKWNIFFKFEIHATNID